MTERRMWPKLMAGTAALLLAATSCSDTGSSAHDDANTASVALTTPSWILPISAPGKTQGENQIFTKALYPGVFSYQLDGDSKYNLDTDRSLAEVPEVSDDGLTYTITLKDRSWSDGEPITSRDVEFWFNLVKANKEDWASYSKGQFPDNVADFSVEDERTFTITTTKKYSASWFIGNQLLSLTPIPQHAWDKTSDDGEVSDLDRDSKGAQKVFDYLRSAAKTPSEYAEDDLWKTVSGPWTLKAFTPSGDVSLVPNESYDGADAPELDEVDLKPFTDDNAEFNVLRSGGIDYGYIPSGSIAQQAVIEESGYTVDPWYSWGITYMPLNFNNPTSGPIFQQKYVRQAMQQLIDQKTIAKVLWQGSAAPTCGPVPQKPGEAGTDKGCAYDFDPDAAVSLLKEHGWSVTPDGTTTCARPGTAEDQCGKGIPKGAPLTFSVTSQSGFDATTKMMEELKSQFSRAGIVLNIQEVPDSVAVTQQCEPDAECDWDMSYFGSQGSWIYGPYASGERLFATGAPVNLGSYSDPKADELIDATQHSDDPKAMDEYNDYLAEDLPVLWLPNPVSQISAYRTDLEGVEQDPMVNMYPQDWSRS